MKELIAGILDGYGNWVSAEAEEGAQGFRAFLQPVTQRGWENAKKLMGTLGEFPKETYLCIAPAQAALSEGTKITAQGQTYRVKRSEKIYLADEVLYTWALLTKAGGEAPWSS